MVMGHKASSKSSRVKFLVRRPVKFNSNPGEYNEITEAWGDMSVKLLSNHVSTPYTVTTRLPVTHAGHQRCFELVHISGPGPLKLVFLFVIP